MRNFFRAWSTGVAVGSLVTIAAFLLLRPASPPAELGRPARELKAQPTTRLECQPLIVYADQVKPKLGLPADVQGDPNRQVTAATQISNNDHSHTVSAVANLTTGQIDLFIRRDPLPWLSTTTRHELGLAYGIHAGELTPRIEARREFLQLKAVHVGIMGNANTRGDWFAGVGVWVRW